MMRETGLRYMLKCLTVNLTLSLSNTKGVPVSPSRLHVIDWLPLEEKSKKRLAVWKGGNMSIAGRTTLINSSLNNAPIYQMSIYLLPKTVVANLDRLRRIFLAGRGNKKEISPD